MGGDGSTSLARMVEDGLDDRRATRIAARHEKKEPMEQRRPPRDDEKLEEPQRSLDHCSAAGRDDMIQTSQSCKSRRSPLVSETAKTLIFSMERNLGEETSVRNLLADRKVLGKAVEIEGAGAALDAETGKVTLTDGEVAGDAASQTRLSRLVCLIGVGMVRECKEIDGR